MNKLDLIATLKNEAQLTKSEATAVIELFFDEMNAALVKGDRVEIRRFCSFYVKKYKAYVGRNPKTGETVDVASKKLPYFKCGKGLREMVNGR